MSLLAKLKQDSVLQEKFKKAVDLDAAEALAREAGFDVSKADWLRYQASKTITSESNDEILELNDEELEGVIGGKYYGTCSQCWKGNSGTWNYDC